MQTDSVYLLNRLLLISQRIFSANPDCVIPGKLYQPWRIWRCKPPWEWSRRTLRICYSCLDLRKFVGRKGLLLTCKWGGTGASGRRESATSCFWKDGEQNLGTTGEITVCCKLVSHWVDWKQAWMKGYASKGDGGEKKIGLWSLLMSIPFYLGIFNFLFWRKLILPVYILIKIVGFWVFLF